MNLLIVGDTGFLASNFIKEFGANYQITGINRSNFKFDIKSYKKLLQNQFDLILFTAAQSSAGLSWKETDKTLVDNILIFINLLIALKKIKLNNCKILYFSSAEVYGAYDRLIDETDVFNPMNPYAVSKVAIENLINIYRNEGFNIKVMRPFPIIGPGQSANFAIPNFVNQIKLIQEEKVESVIKHGNLSAKRDFTDVRYFCKITNHLIQNFDELKYNEYNICSGNIYSIEEILKLLIKQSNMNIELILDPFRVRPIDLPLLAGQNARITEEIEATPYSISDTIKYILQNS